MQQDQSFISSLRGAASAANQGAIAAVEVELKEAAAKGEWEMKRTISKACADHLTSKGLAIKVHKTHVGGAVECTISWQ